MAQKEEPSKHAFETLAWDNKFLANQKPLSFADARALLEVWCHRRQPGDSPFSEYWDADHSAASCLTFIGEKGCGKSTLIKQFARDHEYELRRIMMGDSMDEDNMGVFQREYDEEGHHTFTLPEWMPMNPPKGGKGGIAFIDECGTGTGTHQNMISTLLTDGYDNGYYGHCVEKGWFWVAATNPDEVQYHLNQQLDARVRDRMFPVYIHPKPAEVMHYLGKNGKIPDFIYGFMMMNKGMIDVVSARKWEMVGAFAHRWLATRKLSRITFLQMMRLNLPPGTIDAISKYMELGDDPSAYPMLAKDIIAADDKAHGEHVTRMRQWGRRGRDALVGATAYDIARYFGDSEIKLTEPQIQWLAEVTEQIAKTDMVSTILDAASGTNRSPQLVKFIKSHAVAERLAGLMDRQTQYQQEAGM